MSQKLMLEKIEKAQREIDTKREVVKHGKMRQCYHFMGETGWINDPNGLIYFRGKYHYFYQHNPFNGFWDSMYWGHAVSDDLIHWEYLPLALAPSEYYDNHLKGGCFSGSAIEHDGKLYLVYTGTCNNGNGFEQAQCIAYSEDGIHFEKYKGNPVISAPKGVPTDMFRDPKVWKHEDTFYLVCGASMNGFAQARLYKSKDMLNWEFVNVLAESRGEWGFMWECPDFFELDGKYVLLTSPQDMLPEGLEFHNGNGTLCIIGELDTETHTLKEQFCQGVDYGIDYYAMQTLLAPDGRRIMIAWMQNWDTLAYRCNDSGWFAQMSLPRELSVKNGRLYQVPIRELNAMRANKVEYNNVVIKDTRLTLDQIEGRTVDLELVIRPADKDNLYKKFELCFAENEKYHSTLCFRPDESVLKIDRKFSGSERALVHQSSCLVNGDSNELKLRVILDKFSVEVFINDGEQVMSAVILTKQEAKGISFFADGAAKIDVVKYDLV